MVSQGTNQLFLLIVVAQAYASSTDKECYRSNPR